MNGWWILVIVSAVVLIIGIMLFVVFYWDSELWMGLGFVLAVIGGGCLISFLIIAIVDPLGGKREYTTFLEQRAIIEEIVDDPDDIINAGVNNIIIETNTWLAEAKASKKIYGIFSRYYGIPLEEIEPIKIFVGGSDVNINERV